MDWLQVAGEQVPGQSGLKEETKDAKSIEENRKQKPLLPKSAVLRLLSEFIKSYSSCTQLITQYSYKAGQSELISEVGLTFLGISYSIYTYICKLLEYAGCQNELYN